MQYYLIVPNVNNDIDIINQAIPAPNRWRVFDTKADRNTTYPVAITSAHDVNMLFTGKTQHKTKTSEAKLIAVISYIPDMQSEEWPAFYTNLCMADILACDSSIQQQLNTNITYPPKRIILLDGVSPQSSEYIEPKFLKFYSIDHNKKIWDYFARLIHRDYKDRSDIRIVHSPVADAIGIGFYPIAPALAVYLSHKLRFLSVPYDEYSSQYLDCRQNHELQHLTRLSDIGGIANKQIIEALTEYVKELELLVNNTAEMPLLPFSSNHNLFDRIFMEINRTQ